MWVELVGIDGVPQRREIAIVDRIVDGARLDDLGLSLGEGKTIQRRLQEEMTQFQTDQAAQQIGNVTNATAFAEFMIIDLVRFIRSSAYVGARASFE